MQTMTVAVRGLELTGSRSWGSASASPVTQGLRNEDG